MGRADPRRRVGAAAAEGRLTRRHDDGPGRPDGDPALAAPFTALDVQRVGRFRRWLRRHPVATDVLVAGCYAVPALVSAAPTSGASSVWLVVLTVAAAAALLFRRRAPVWTLVATVALGVTALVVSGTTFGIDAAVAFALYAVAAYRRTRAAWLTLAGAAACLVVAAVAVGPAPGPPGAHVEVTRDGVPTTTALDDVTAQLSGFVVLGLVALAVGTSVRTRREHVAELVDRANRVAREHAQRAELAAAAERTRIAREMHDIVAHSLSVMVTLADGAAASIDRSPDAARAAVARLSDTGRAALADTRRLLGVLRDEPTPLGPQPGERDLDELVAGFREAGLPVHLTVAGPPLPDDPSLQLAVYRIVQESLTNVLRHAPGTGRVEVRIATSGGGVRVDVVDDGAAGGRPPVGDDAGRGIVGMRERAAVYGGSVEAGPMGAGWRVTARLAAGDGGAGATDGGAGATDGGRGPAADPPGARHDEAHDDGTDGA